MKVAALITWVITALGGFYLLSNWISRGGLRQQQSGVTRLRAPLIFGHFLLAAAGLIVWIIYLLANSKALAWVAFVILLPVALLGFTMFFRWLGVRRAGVPAPAGPVPAPAGLAPPGSAPAGSARAGSARAGSAALADEARVPAERHLPIPVVAAHGLLAATTIVLVLLAALGVG